MGCTHAVPEQENAWIFSLRLGKRRDKWLGGRKEKAEQKEIGHEWLGTAWAGGGGPG